MEDAKFYWQIVESMPGGFFVYHADGDEELIYANEALFRIFGCDTMEEFKELTGYTFKGIVHPDDLEMAEESIWRQIDSSSDDLDYLEYRIIRKDGSVRWVEDYGHFAHTDHYGDVFYVFIDDATERMTERMRQLEEMNAKLRLAYTKEQQYKNAIMHDSMAFFEANLTKDLLISPVVQVVNGVQTDIFELMGMEPVESVTELVEYFEKRRGPSSGDSYMNFFNVDRLVRCFGKGELEQVYETWATDHMGRRRLFRYTILLAKDEETQDVLGLCLLRDLTNLEDGRILLELAFDRAKTSMMDRDAFLSNLSHDMRNPLNAIVGYANILKDVQSSPEQFNKYIEKIQLFSEQLLNVVDGSLEYSRLENGRTVLSERRGSILQMLDHLKEQVLLMSDVKEQTFTLDTSEITHEFIAADFVRLRNVLYKLIDNAVKYTPKGGSVSLVVQEKQGLAMGYAWFHFIVRDNGIGMDEKLREKVFEPFSRGQNMAESGIIGSGLGMSVAKSLVEMMEGNIQVESEPGKGSCIIVDLLFRLAEDENECE